MPAVSHQPSLTSTFLSPNMPRMFLPYIFVSPLLSAEGTLDSGIVHSCGDSHTLTVLYALSCPQHFIFFSA